MAASKISCGLLYGCLVGSLFPSVDIYNIYWWFHRLFQPPCLSVKWPGLILPFILLLLHPCLWKVNIQPHCSEIVCGSWSYFSHPLETVTWQQLQLKCIAAIIFSHKSQWDMSQWHHWPQFSKAQIWPTGSKMCSGSRYLRGDFIIGGKHKDAEIACVLWHEGEGNQPL